MDTRTPMEKAIDEACGYNPQAHDRWPEPRDTDSHDKQVAMAISQSAIGHIDLMYPKMWEGVASAARRSLGNRIYNEVLNELRFYQSNTPVDLTARQPNT
jgi:hypothetical protein